MNKGVYSKTVKYNILVLFVTFVAVAEELFVSAVVRRVVPVEHAFVALTVTI